MYSSSFLIMSRHPLTLIPRNLDIKDHFFLPVNWVALTLKPKENKLIQKFHFIFITKMTENLSDDPFKVNQKKWIYNLIFTFIHERNRTQFVIFWIIIISRHRWTRHSFFKNKTSNQRLHIVLCWWGWTAALQHTSQKMWLSMIPGIVIFVMKSTIFTLVGCVLVQSGCYKEIPQIHFYISQFWRLGFPRSTCTLVPPEVDSHSSQSKRASNNIFFLYRH